MQCIVSRLLRGESTQRHSGCRHALFAMQIHQLCAGHCLTIKCGRGGIHSLIYCGLGGLHLEGLTSPSVRIFEPRIGLSLFEKYFNFTKILLFTFAFSTDSVKSLRKTRDLTVL